MDWQIVILTFGASIITGAVSLIGNIIVSKSNIKKIQIESMAQDKKLFMRKRFENYDFLIDNFNKFETIFNQENNKITINNDDLLEIKAYWLNDSQYCSMEINRLIYILFLNVEEKYYGYIKSDINCIRDQVKKELDIYYNNREKK